MGHNYINIKYSSDFHTGFHGTLGFREHLPRFLRLVSVKNKNNLACEITSEQAIEVLCTECLVPN